MDASIVLGTTRIVPVVIINDPNDALPLAEALIEAGLTTIEITLRTEAAIESIEKVVTAFPRACIGAGSIRTTLQLAQVKDAGAQFAVSPGSSTQLLDTAAKNNFPFVPGAVTASEIISLQEFGYTLVKFFPAELAGGTKMLAALGAPLPEARFFPTGGITRELAATYLSLPNVPCIGGTWIAPVNLIAAGKFELIAKLAKEALELVT